MQVAICTGAMFNSLAKACADRKGNKKFQVGGDEWDAGSEALLTTHPGYVQPAEQARSALRRFVIMSLVPMRAFGAFLKEWQRQEPWLPWAWGNSIRALLST